MSIIFGTLERLESDGPNLAREKENVEQPCPAAERNGLPVRGLITSLLFVMAAANLLLWYWSHELSVTRHPELSSAIAQRKFPEPIPDILLEATIEESRSSLQMIVPQGKKIHLAEIASAGKVSEAGQGAANKRRTVVEASPRDSSPIEKPVKAHHATAQTVNSRSVKSDSVRARSVEERTGPAAEDSSLAGIEEIIDEARLALSRGRYQQALATLETLAVVPETRADFWLLKGSAYLGTGQLVMAEVALDKAQSAAPYNVNIGVQRSILKQEKGDHAGALAILEPLAERQQHVPEIFLNLGYSQQALGAERAAQRSFRVFLRLTAGRSLYEQQRAAIQEWLTTVPSPN